MSAPQALAVYGLTVGPNQGPVPASTVNFPARFRITMAAIDPTASPEADEDGNLPSVPRSTLKLIRLPSSDSDDEDEDEDDEDDEYLKALINADDSDSDEENGGPSDPEKKKKRAEALAALIKAAQEEESSDEEMTDAKPNGKKSAKGKAKATEEDEDDEDSDDEDDVLVPEEFVLCTLDTERTYQQPLDVVVREDEEVFFLVTGTHAVTLTGNYVESLYDDDEDDYDSEEDDEDMDDDMLGGYSDEESDDLDDVSDPRVTELDSEDDGEEAPALVPAKKGKNKRSAEEVESLDALIAGAGNKEEKLSKKQAKKLKNNQGEAVASEEAAKKKEGKDAKKVQFAKELEQGPTGPASKEAEKKSSVRVVQGITIDDRKVGAGRTVKKGDTVGMRYIGKLQNGKQFDANKKGKPFSFKIGKGEVIKGWEVGILGMAIGGERRLTVPANAAYGSKALPGIPANSTLIFDVKLLEIK